MPSELAAADVAAVETATSRIAASSELAAADVAAAETAASRIAAPSELAVADVAAVETAAPSFASPPDRTAAELAAAETASPGLPALSEPTVRERVAAAAASPGPASPADPTASDLAAAETAAAAPAVAAWVGFVYTAGGIALVPWTVYLAVTLPRTSHSAHYRLAWVGFDILLAFMLLRVGRIAARPRTSDRVELPATSAGTLLLVDAWFDTTTSADTGALVAALILALVAELPMAVICFWIAHHAEDIRERRLRLLPLLEQRVAKG